MLKLHSTFVTNQLLSTLVTCGNFSASESRRVSQKTENNETMLTSDDTSLVRKRSKPFNTNTIASNADMS